MSARKIKSNSRIIEKLELTPTRAEKWRAWIEEHQSKLILVVLGFFLGVAGFGGFTYYSSSRDRQAEAEYARIVNAWPSGESATPQALEPIASELERLVAAYGSSPAARNARLDLAKAYFQMGRHEQALKWSQQAMEAVGADAGLKNIVRYQLALTLEALGRADEAAGQWQMLQGEAGSGFAREAQWHIARSYSRKGDYSKAMEHYEKALKAEGAYPGEPLLQGELAQVKAKVGVLSEAVKNPSETKPQ